jgi:glycosyl hydrolase family 20
VPRRYWTTALLACVAAHAADLDLSKARLAIPAQLSKRESKAVEMLRDEVQKRTQIQLPTMPSAGAPAIAISRGRGPAEGYSLQVAGSQVSIIANDERGMLFGIGRLLREMHMRPGRITIAGDLNITTSPKYPLRGHQLGYRPKTNSYDGWSVPVWEQYIRDLAVFGTNAAELIPPRSDDAADSALFPLPPMQMMTEMSRLLDEYGLDVWIWYPAMDPDYSNPQTVEFALNEWGEVFKKLPRVDAVFVPGGDPGHTEPKVLMSLLEKEARVLRRYHPKAQMWVSPQSFDQQWLDEFLDILKREQPAWLNGVVFGPQIRVALPELRARVPERYPIRHYPDITHSLRSQYPVPDWDVAYAVTEGREVINPRPSDEAVIFSRLQPYTIGFITYSEGCNDDVNKFIWSSLGWDSGANVTDILRQYSRYFIGDEYEDSFAQGLLALERNWRGPLGTNTSVYTTLEQFQSMEAAASPGTRLNWRFQQALYRAYYDAYVRRRLINETTLEEAAMDQLRQANTSSAVESMNRAQQILDRSVAEHPAADWRARVFELAQGLFDSIRMQLSVEKYHAIAVDRGATLDTIDRPLNSRVWLGQRFADIRKMENEAERRAAIDEILNWTNPGPGGFYDDLGDPTGQPHLVRGDDYASDPAFLSSPHVAFGGVGSYRKSFWTHAASLNDEPLRMRYTDLDPAAQYKIRVVYGGDSPRQRIRLVANGAIEIHPFIAKPVPYRPIEFDIPSEATRSGVLNLAWTREPGQGGNGRGCQVSEVWLIRK